MNTHGLFGPFRDPADSNIPFSPQRRRKRGESAVILSEFLCNSSVSLRLRGAGDFDEPPSPPGINGLTQISAMADSASQSLTAEMKVDLNKHRRPLIRKHEIEAGYIDPDPAAHISNGLDAPLLVPRAKLTIKAAAPT